MSERKEHSIEVMMRDLNDQNYSDSFGPKEVQTRLVSELSNRNDLMPKQASSELIQKKGPSEHSPCHSNDNEETK